MRFRIGQSELTKAGSSFAPQTAALWATEEPPVGQGSSPAITSYTVYRNGVMWIGWRAPVMNTADGWYRLTEPVKLEPGTYSVKVHSKLTMKGPPVVFDFAVGDLTPAPNPGTPAPDVTPPTIKVRMAGTVLPWKDPDWTQAQKVDLNSEASASGWFRWYKSLAPNSKFAQFAKDVKDLSAAGGKQVIMIHWRPADWSKPQELADRIHDGVGATPNVILPFLNEVNKAEYGWMQSTLEQTLRNAFGAALPVARLLKAKGHTELAAPCLTTPSTQSAQLYVKVLRELDPDKVFNWINVHFYTDDPAYVRNSIKVLRDACDADGRKLLVDEWGLPGNKLSVQTFDAIAAEILPVADLSCLWLLAESFDAKNGWYKAITLYTRDELPTPAKAIWDEKLLQPIELTVQEQTVLKGLNAIRAKAGEPPLVIDGGLQAAAREQASAAGLVLSNKSPTGAVLDLANRQPSAAMTWQQPRMTSVGCSELSNGDLLEDVMAWDDGSEHGSQIRNPSATKVGVAVVNVKTPQGAFFYARCFLGK